VRSPESALIVSLDNRSRAEINQTIHARMQERRFFVGDRIQFIAPASELKVANRELATVEHISDGSMRLKMDGGRAIEIDPRQHPHLDYGYAVTSHNNQGQTAERVLINVDTELAARDLLNSRMAYVAVLRGAHDAQIFTNDVAGGCLGTRFRTLKPMYWNWRLRRR
jgi:ATP-dependent exoDNAse (exonuclease V) alpha subunit